MQLNDGAPALLEQGRYGPYVSHGSVNAALPKTLKSPRGSPWRLHSMLAAKTGASAKRAG